MTVEELEKLFEKYGEDEYLKFDNVQSKFCNRSDLNAFIILNQLISDDNDIISGSEHDEYYLSVDLEKLAEVISEEEVADLVRCGVMYNHSYDCLYLFS